MKDHEGKGGSYLRQADGSLKLVERTDEPKPQQEIAPAPAAKKGK